MDFRFKNALQHLFSSIPFGHRLNFFFQRHITKSYPSSLDIFKVKVDQGEQHLVNFKELNSIKNPQGLYYEFGAGWDLIIPLYMSASGFEVHCIDLRKLLVVDLINDSLQKFKKLNYTGSVLKFDLEKIESVADLKKSEIHYFAPVDATQTGFTDSTYDFMSSTSTMEHIPSSDILPILIECERILKPGGILSLLTDYKDHWSYFDQNLGIYNFLKYSEQEWKKYNPDLHYQNRLRHSEYMEIISKSGFEVVKESVYHATEKQLEDYHTLNPSSEFKGFSLKDLTATGSEIVLRKKIDYSSSI